MVYKKFKAPEHLAARMRKFSRVDLTDRESLKSWYLEYCSTTLNTDLASLFTKDPEYMIWTYAMACQSLMKRMLDTMEGNDE